MDDIKGDLEKQIEGKKTYAYIPSFSTQKSY